MWRFCSVFFSIVFISGCSSKIYIDDGTIIKREQHTVGHSKNFTQIKTNAKTMAISSASLGGIIGGGLGAMAGSLTPGPRPIEGALIGGLGLGVIFGVIGATTGATYGLFSVLISPKENDTWVYTVKSASTSNIYTTEPQAKKMDTNTKVKIFKNRAEFIAAPLS